MKYVFIFLKKPRHCWRGYQQIPIQNNVLLRLEVRCEVRLVFVLRFGNGYAHLILEIAAMAATLYTLIDDTEGEDMSIASVGIARQ